MGAEDVLQEHMSVAVLKMLQNSDERPVKPSNGMRINANRPVVGRYDQSAAQELSREQIRRAEDEMVGIYTSREAIGEASDLSFAYMIRPNRAQSERTDFAVAKTQKPPVPKATGSQRISDQPTMKRVDDEVNTNQKRWRQQRWQEVQQRIPVQWQSGKQMELQQLKLQQESAQKTKHEEKSLEPDHDKHDNTCIICTSRVYFLKTRCLVCGKLYCTNCVGKGMGQMAEGRKCKECLGKRFGKRYQDRVGRGLALSRKTKEAEIKASLKDMLLEIRGKSIH